MIRIQLSFQDRWQESSGNYLVGAAFIGDEPCDVLASIPSSDKPNFSTSLVDFVKRLNGFFAMIVRPQQGLLFAAVDRLRSTPLYYWAEGDNFFLSDDPEWILRELGNRAISSVPQTEFLLAGYVTGEETLYSNVKQLQAGEYLWVTESNGQTEVKVDRYFLYQHTRPVQQRESELLRLHDMAVDQSIARLIHYANGRTILLPLSGGLDSRLIAIKLRSHGYSNVVCFTYGLPGNAEAEISKQVASKLGFHWEFVPYTLADWKDWSQLPEWTAYSHFAQRAVSVPHFQDWPAIRFLVGNGIVPVDSVAVPGHTADVLAGSYLGPQFFYGQRFSASKLRDCIWIRHYALQDSRQLARMYPTLVQETSACMRKIGSILAFDGHPMTSESAASSFERWGWQERQAKFIVNSVRVYEFFGLDWWLPLWDVEMMAFWASVPLSSRENTRLYHHYMAMIQTEEGLEFPIPPRGVGHGHIQKGLRVFLNRMGVLETLKRWKQTMNAPDARAEYYGHPLAWFGIMDFPSFAAAYTGRESINTFLARKMIQDL